MILTVDDQVLANTTTEPVLINLENDRYKAIVPRDNVAVSIDDSYQVIPWSRRVTVDYTLPDYLTQQVQIDIADLRADLLTEIGARELAFIDATNYTNEYVDGVATQLLTDIEATYVSNVEAGAYILKTELAAYQITYDTGSGLTTASFQELNDTVVAVENAQASYTEDLNIHVTNTAAIADRTTTLEASALGLEASIVSTDGVSAGVIHTWNGVEPLLVGYIYDILGVTHQYLGGALGVNNDGWVVFEDTLYSTLTNLEAQTGVSLADLQSQIDGEIASWFYSVAPSSIVVPESTWIANDTTNGNNLEKIRHIGDMYYDDVSGTAYRYSYIDPNASGTWNVITDTAIASALAQASEAQDTADGKRAIYYSSTAPTVNSQGVTLGALDTGDMWVNSTTDITKVWSGTAWEDTTNTTADTAIGWAGGASKLITAPDGSVTGWSFADGSNVDSTFAIQADKFYLGSSSIPGYRPFSVDGTNVTFNGKISFTSITDAPDLVSDNTNINITSNLVATDGWILPAHANYQWIGTPTYSESIGAGDFLERQLLLGLGDEVYTPHLIEMNKVYQLSYAFKGGTPGEVVLFDGVGITSTTPIISGTPTLDPAKWYLVQAILNPNGTVPVNTYGKVKDAVTYETVATIDDVTMDLTGTAFVMGFSEETTISRVNIAYMTEETLSIDYVDGDYVATATIDLAKTDMSNVTTIDGGKITTDSIKTLQLDTTEIKAGTMFVDNTVVSNGFTFGATSPITSGATPTGFRLDARSTSGSETLPSIYGAYIRGATIDSSTLHVRDLIVVTDAGLPTATFVYSVLTPSTAKSQDFLYTFDIYGYNDAAAIADGKRLVGTSGVLKTYSVVGTLYSELGQIISDSPAVGGTSGFTVTLYLGAAVIGQYSIDGSYTETGSYLMAGIQFYFDPTSYMLGVRSYNNYTGISGVGQLKVRVEVPNPRVIAGVGYFPTGEIGFEAINL